MELQKKKKKYQKVKVAMETALKGRQQGQIDESV